MHCKINGALVQHHAQVLTESAARGDQAGVRLGATVALRFDEAILDPQLWIESLQLRTHLLRLDPRQRAAARTQP